MRTAKRIAEEEFILVVLLAGFGLIFLLIFPPAIVVNDSWLNLMAGREVIENGLPSHDELTVYGLGSTWTDQQWLAQIVIYGAYSLGGFPLLSILTAALVVTAFSIAAAAARSLGAGPRAFWVLFLPVLAAAPWAWSVRAQMVALPLYTGLLWLLASEARRPTRRVWLAFLLLVVWANLHGSVALGALLVMLLGGYELVRSRGRSWRRSLALVALPPLAALATPYGPVATAEYYHLLLVDPPFAGRVTEWRWAEPAVNTLFFYVLVAIAIPLVYLGRRRLALFDLAVLALTARGRRDGNPGDRLVCACLHGVSARVHRAQPREPASCAAAAAREHGDRRRVHGGSHRRCRLPVPPTASRGSRSTGPGRPWKPCAASFEPGDKVFAPDRFSDWLLWKIPELRGRVAYDVRFEVYDREFFDRLQEYAGETGADWKSFADGYRIVLVDETRRSHTADFLAEPGARAVYRDDEITVIVRPRS